MESSNSVGRLTGSVAGKRLTPFEVAPGLAAAPKSVLKALLELVPELVPELVLKLVLEVLSVFVASVMLAVSPPQPAIETAAESAQINSINLPFFIIAPFPLYKVRINQHYFIRYICNK
jgi:hypothetical protein